MMSDCPNPITFEGLAPFGDRAALVHDGHSCTYAELDRAVDGFAGRLVSMGVAVGDHVALWGLDSINWVVAALAIVRAGAVAVLVNPMLSVGEARPLLDLTESRFLLFGDVAATRADPRAAEALSEAAGIDPSRHLCIRQSVCDLVASFQAPPAEALPAHSPDRTAFIIFTSGSTSLPKAVRHSSRSIVAIVSETTSRYADVQMDRYLIACPLFHMLALSTAMIVLAHGCTIVLSGSYRACDLVPLIDDMRICCMTTVGAIYQSLMGHEDFGRRVAPHIRFGTVAGGVSTPTQMMRMELSFEHAVFLNAYGLSETGPITMALPGDPVELRAATVGRPVDGASIMVVDELGSPLPCGRTGEVLARCDSLMQGYMNVADEDQPIDAAGWLHTGDLGYVDGQGYLHLAGRIKDIIIRGGENVVPAEVADELLRLDNVSQAAVLGAPNPVLGESVEACVMLDDPTVPFDAIAARAALCERLSHAKVPSHIFVMDAFPLLGSGKVDMGVLRARMLNALRRANALEDLRDDLTVFDVTVKSLAYAVPPIAEMVSSMAGWAGFSADGARRINLACEEMLCERIMHAYDSVGSVRVRMVLKTDCLRLAFSDSGAEYRIDARRETSPSARIVLFAVDRFSTMREDGQTTYNLDFSYERDMDVVGFLVKCELLREDSSAETDLTWE